MKIFSNIGSNQGGHNNKLHSPYDREVKLLISFPQYSRNYNSSFPNFYSFA